MDKYKKYYGTLLFIAVAVFTLYFSYNTVMPKYESYTSLVSQAKQKQSELDDKKNKSQIVRNKFKKIKDSNSGVQKKIYYPSDADLGDDTLFYTLYSDLLEMVQGNSVKIKSIKYEYNPESDAFVRLGKGEYFVSDINMEIISNFVNLGKLIQDIHQYPYYMKINKISIEPYQKDKTVLISKVSLRLYAHVAPNENVE